MCYSSPISRSTSPELDEAVAFGGLLGGDQRVRVPRHQARAVPARPVARLREGVLA